MWQPVKKGKEGEREKSGKEKRKVPYPLSPVPNPHPFYPPIPWSLTALPFSTPATQATLFSPPRAPEFSLIASPFRPAGHGGVRLSKQAPHSSVTLGPIENRGSQRFFSNRGLFGGKSYGSCCFLAGNRMSNGLLQESKKNNNNNNKMTDQHRAIICWF